MLKSSGAMAAATMTSRVLGLVREIVYASFMGVGMVAGAFQLAFQIPNLFRRLLGEGALTASFIPIFKEKQRTAAREEMWRSANAVISGLLAVASLLSLLAMLALTAVLHYGPYERELPPGFAPADFKDLSALAKKLTDHDTPALAYLWQRISEPTRLALSTVGEVRTPSREIKVMLAAEFNGIIRDGPIYEPERFAGTRMSEETTALIAAKPSGEKLNRLNQLLVEAVCAPMVINHIQETGLMLRLLRVMFPYMLLICLTAIFMGMLNALGHFFIPASGAVVMNLIMIASVYLLAPRMGRTLDQQIFALAIGVLVAGTAQALFQLSPLRSEGFRYYWVSPWRDETVGRVVRQMIPGAIGIAAFQINVLTTQGIAFWVDPSIVAKFNLAVRLMELPQGVFGVSLATYLLPTLSGLAAERKHAEFRATLNHGVDHLALVNLLATVLLLFLAEPIIRLLFEHGKFLAADTPKVAYALVWLAPGLLAFSMVNILARAFYALGDTRTPMKFSIACLAVNLALALMLVWRMRQGGLALANSLSAFVNVFLLYRALRGKLGELELASLKRILLRLLLAASLGGLAAWGLSHWWEVTVGHVGLLRRLGAVFVPMTAAAAVYAAVTLGSRVPPAMEIGGLLLDRLGGRGRRQSGSSDQ